MVSHEKRARALGQALHKYEGKILPTHESGKVKVEFGSLSKDERIELVNALMGQTLDWNMVVKDGRIFKMFASFREQTYEEIIKPLFHTTMDVLFTATKTKGGVFTHSLKRGEIDATEGTKETMEELTDYLRTKIPKNLPSTIEATINSPRTPSTKLDAIQKIIKKFIALIEKHGFTHGYDESDETLYVEEYLKMDKAQHVIAYKSLASFIMKNVDEIQEHEISIDSSNDGCIILKGICEEDYELVNKSSTRTHFGKFKLICSLNDSDTLNLHNITLYDSKENVVYEDSTDSICQWNAYLLDLFYYNNVDMNITMKWKGL